MQRNRNGIVVLVILLLLAALAVWFLFFRKGAPEPPPPTATAKPTTIAPKPTPLSLLIEKEEHYETGELRARYTVFRERPEIKQGKYQEFYPSQAKKIACDYVENVVQGPFLYWYENGQEAMRGSMKDGMREGPFAEFHPSGKPKIEATYRAGALDGAYREYYDADNKPVMFEKTYADGALAGPVVVRKPDGSVKYTIEAAAAREDNAAPSATEGTEGPKAATTDGATEEPAGTADAG